MEDVRSYSFQPLSIDKISEEQLEAVDNLIDDLLVEEHEVEQNQLYIFLENTSFKMKKSFQCTLLQGSREGGAKFSGPFRAKSLRFPIS